MSCFGLFLSGKFWSSNILLGSLDTEAIFNIFGWNIFQQHISDAIFLSKKILLILWPNVTKFNMFFNIKLSNIWSHCWQYFFAQKYCSRNILLEIFHPKILNISSVSRPPYVILLCTHLYHFFPVYTILYNAIIACYNNVKIYFIGYKKCALLIKI